MTQVTHEVHPAHYAGFWVRFLSVCIDMVAYMPLYMGMKYAFDVYEKHMHSDMVNVSNTVDYLSAQSASGDVYHWWFEVAFGIISLASYAWFFSSRWQGSPGMHLLKFHVCDTKGARISYMRAFMWCVTGTVGWLICCAGILYLQKDIYVVRDMLASCQEQNIDLTECAPEIEKVIGIPYVNFQQLMLSATGFTLFMFVIWALSIALPKDKTGFHNLVCGTRFVSGRPPTDGRETLPEVSMGNEIRHIPPK